METTAATLRAEAAAADRAATESFDRCDTDGFVSQWASGMTAQLKRQIADIEDAGGRWEFRGLYDGDRRVVAKMIDTKFGRSWLLDDAEAAAYGRRYLPVGENSRVHKTLGLRERGELQAAKVILAGGGRGFSGLSSVSVIVVRVGDVWGRDAILEAVARS